MAVLLLDRPQQATCLVEVAVVGRAVEGGEPLRTQAPAAATVADAVGAGAVPGHADEQRAVVAVVGRPPLLRVRHQGHEVAPDCFEVEGGELRGIVEVGTHRVGRRGVAVQHLQVKLVRPPLPARRRPCGVADPARVLVGHLRVSSHGGGAAAGTRAGVVGGHAVAASLLGRRRTLRGTGQDRVGSPDTGYRCRSDGVEVGVLHVPDQAHSACRRSGGAGPSWRRSARVPV